jgi:hypothetical protein
MTGRKLRGALFVSLFIYAAWACADDAKGYFGHWRVTGIAEYASVSSISDAQAKKKIGRDLVMSERSLAFDHYSCKPRYAFSRVDPEKDLEEGYRISNVTLKLPNPVVVIDTGCERSRYIYVVNRNQLVLEQSGVFYRANRLSGSRALNPSHSKTRRTER